MPWSTIRKRIERSKLHDLVKTHSFARTPERQDEVWQKIIKEVEKIAYEKEE